MGREEAGEGDRMGKGVQKREREEKRGQNGQGIERGRAERAQNGQNGERRGQGKGTGWAE